MPSDIRALANLLPMGDEASEDCPEADFAAMFRHQIHTPLIVNLAPPVDVEHGPEGSQPHSAATTFGDLLHQPSPPLAWLRSAKTFAKLGQHHTEDCLLPRPLATLLYFACIAAALCRYGASITELDNDAIQNGLAWSLRQPWIDPSIRQLFRLALDKLNSKDKPD